MTSGAILKRKASPLACFLCLKAGELCDERHPCGRCVSKGVSQMCFNSDFNNKKSHSHISKQDLKGIHPVPQEGRRQAETGLYNEPMYGATHEDIGTLLNELRVIRDDQKKLHDEVRALKQQNERLETKLGLSTFAKQLEANTTQLNVTNGRIAVGLATLAERLNSNNNPRTVRPKIDPSIVHTLTPRNAPPPPISISSEDGSGHPSHSLIVVFDLTTKPATVMSATDNFCKMMGYAMHEVTGMPWHKFIHPSYVDRTMNIFNQTHLNTTIQFSQVYKTKDDHIFHTLDTHKIFYGTDGKPISDIVSILLQKNQNAPLPSPPNQLLSLTEEGIAHDADGPLIYSLDEALTANNISSAFQPPPQHSTQQSSAPQPISSKLLSPFQSSNQIPMPSSVHISPLPYSPTSPSAVHTLPTPESINLTHTDLDLDSFICSLPTDDLTSYVNMTNSTATDELALTLDQPAVADATASTSYQPNASVEPYGDIFEYILSP